ncbi:MAG TPA: PKD domain-containing protein, partial [Bacteroidia bacterium]|nr:PKD domain-containing protein [Bacteroidia bacterium]
MTHFKTLFALVTASLLATNLFSAPVTQYLKFEVVDNSNLAVQQPTSILMSFSSLGTDLLDPYDVGNQYAIGSLNEMVYPFALTANNDIITGQDASPDLTGYKRIRFGFATKFPATIKIIAHAFGNSTDSTNRPTYAWIEQISTGYIYPILNDTVKINVPANLNFDSDFYLHTGPQITSGKTDETCYHSYNGSITVNNPATYNWTIKVYQNTTLLVNAAVNQPDTTIANLTSGMYSAVTCINSIPVDSTGFFIDGAAQIIPDFSIDNYYPTTSDVVNFTNASSGAVAYNWDFGDGNSDTATNTTHQYLMAGNYGISLTATNSIGCQETLYDSVYVSTSTIANQFSNGSPMIANPGGLNNTTSIKSFDPSVSCPSSTEKIIVNHTDEQIVSIR